MRFLSVLLILFGVASLSAQRNLSELAADLSSALKEVYVAKLSNAQSLTADANTPYIFTIKRIATNDKGKSTEEKWIFNLADIDPKPLRVETAKDALRINLRAVKAQKFIRYYKEGNFAGYTDQATLFGQGIDNAREIEALLQEAIPLALAQWAKKADLDDKSPQQLIDRLRSLVQDMSLDGTDYRIRLEQMTDYPDRLKLHLVTSTGKSSKQEAFIWSLGDLKAGGPRLQMSGANAIVEAPAKDNMAWIFVESEGVQQHYAKELNIRVSDPDQGKLVVDILEKLIPFGEAEIKKRLPQPGTAPDLLAQISASMGKVSGAKTETIVSLERNCLTQLTEKQGAVEAIYAFHLGDLNPKSVKLNIQKDRVEVNAAVQLKNAYVWVAKEGERQNYQDEVVFLLPDVEKGRLVAHLLPDLIDRCQEAPTAGSFADLEKLATNGANIEGGDQQTLSLQSPGQNCKWKFVLMSTTGKNTSESTYEFNAYDLDPEQVKIVVSRKTASIQLQTLNKQNIIATNINGKPGYVASLQFEVADIVAAKTAKATLESLIVGCKQ